MLQKDVNQTLQLYCLTYSNTLTTLTLENLIQRQWDAN